jgi:hypothetical protein
MITWPWQWKKRALEAEAKHTNAVAMVVRLIQERDEAVDKHEKASAQIVHLHLQIRRMSER